jgi:hypothetical protein
MQVEVTAAELVTSQTGGRHRTGGLGPAPPGACAGIIESPSHELVLYFVKCYCNSAMIVSSFIQVGNLLASRPASTDGDRRAVPLLQVTDSESRLPAAALSARQWVTACGHWQCDNSISSL